MHKISSVKGEIAHSRSENADVSAQQSQKGLVWRRSQDISTGNSDTSADTLKQKTTFADSLRPANILFPEDNGIQPQIEKEKEEKHDLFKLEDESIDLTPPVQLQIQVSDFSQQELFTPKINFAQTEIGSPRIENFHLQFRTVHSFLQLPLQPKESHSGQELSVTEKAAIRKQKVERYLRKKIHRSFRNRVSYHSRKTVAESRLRAKGRFITKSQAEQILGSDLSRLCNKQIKTLLQHHS